MTDHQPANSAEREVLSPSTLNRHVRDLLEQNLGLIWVEGELSNCSRPSSGHLYFSLKDAQAQVRCAMFKPKSLYLRFKPADGLRVLVRARVSLYEARGEFQLIVEHMEEAGEGALQRAFDELKTRLAAEGLFDAAHKKPLPQFPQRIGVITSPSGAAIRDVLSVINRRFALTTIEILPVPVQGKEAPAAIVAMLGAAERTQRHDVLLITRGGGSLEDLCAFNDEAVARAIYKSTIPVISAIGHEIDFTIADFVADLRAPTPSAAAELLVPDINELLRNLRQRRERLYQLWRRIVEARVQRLDHAFARLRVQRPFVRLQSGRERLAMLSQRLHTITARRLETRALHLGELARALNAVSPLATLERGYAILLERDSGRVVRSVAQIAPGIALRARVADGIFDLSVKN